MLESKKMEKYFNSLKKDLHSELSKSARGYLDSGLKLFHMAKKSSYSSIQPSIGNLGIAIELMIKAFLVKNNPILIFCSLPLELQILFTCPEKMPKNFNWRSYDVDIRSYAYKTIELDVCISSFYTFFPEHKQALQPYFRFLAHCRNKSVHASIPSFQKFDLERTAYLSLRVCEILKKVKAFDYFAYTSTEEDKEFISAFQEARIERVRKKIEDAKKKSKSITKGTLSIYVDDWDLYTTNCPICGSECILTGYTDITGYPDEDSDIQYDLGFFAETFECEDCRLKLDDAKELELAGMEIFYDRSSDLDKWFKTHPPDFS